MSVKIEKELSARRATILQDSLNDLREDISQIRTKDESVLKAYSNLENAFSEALDAEAKYRVALS